MEQSSDFVELLGLAGLGQVEVHSTTPADVDLETGRIIAHWQKTKQGSANPLFVKFTEPGKLPERPKGMRILMALEVKFLSRSALAFKI